MGLEKKRDTDSPPDDDGKDLMQSTLIALGWEESKDGEGTHKSPSKDDVIKQLKQENQALAKQLEEKIATISASEARISTMAGEIDRLKAKLEQLEKASIAIAPVVAAATSPGGDVKDLAEKLAIQKEVTAGLEAKLKALAASREDNVDNRGKIEVELASKQAEIDSLYDKVKEATTKIDEQARALSVKDATIADQGQKINELDECVKDLKQQVVDIIGENTGLGSEVQTKLEQLSQRESKINQLEGRLRDQEAEIAKSRVSISTLKSENEELHYRIKEYETVIEKHKKDLLQTESDTSEGMGRLQQIIDDLKEEIATLKKDKQAATSRSEVLARQVDDGEKKRIGVEAVLDKTSKDLAFYQEKYFDLKARLKAVDVQIDELQRSNEQKSALIKDLELARATFDAAKKTMDAEHAKLAAELESQKAAMAEKLKVMEEGGVFKAKLEQAEARIGQLEA
ncbi:MAG: hypothetical protein GYA24_21695, partial [Candidatus Lokiarchaeota archaeon]|nr:hypothetical protein [Candidatus Lokiarchaeota archaeon]